jgi:Uma2 family endonuclease
MVVRAAAARSLDLTFFDVSDVVLAVEVVSPESAVRDRGTKMVKYAQAGIPHFWLVEREDDRAVVRVHERDATTERYVETGVHRGELKLGVPFPLTVDLDALGRRPG